MKGFSVLSFFCIETIEGLIPPFHLVNDAPVLRASKERYINQMEVLSSSVEWFVIETAAIESRSLRTLEFVSRAPILARSRVF